MSGTLIEVLFIFIVFAALVWAAPKLGFGEIGRVILILLMVVLLALTVFRGPFLI